MENSDDSAREAYPRRDPRKDSDNYLYIGESLRKSGTLQEVEKLLCYRGGHFFQASGYATARVILENNPIRVVLIDHDLDECSGLDFMRWIYSIAFIPSIIVIDNPACSFSLEAVVALEAGAADVVDVDIAARELSARIHACTRKYFHPNSEMPSSETSRDGTHPTRSIRAPLYFSPHNSSLYFSDSSKVILHGKEASILGLFISRYPDYISREEISRNIFGRHWNPNDRSVDNLISRLRKTVDQADSDASTSIIETIRNGGYRLRSAIGMLSPENDLIAGKKTDLNHDKPFT